MTTRHPHTKKLATCQLGQSCSERFRQAAQLEMARALTILAEEQMPDIAKNLTGLSSGMMELALKYRGDAFRVIYALQNDDDIWVVHAFQKKSMLGIKTPKAEIDLVHERLKRLKERLR
jgi:phage-related protein